MGRTRPWSVLLAMLVAGCLDGGSTGPTVEDFHPAPVGRIGRLRSPSRIAIHEGGLLVADTSRGVVEWMTTDGKRIQTLVGARRPIGVASAPARPGEAARIYVGDDQDGSVKVLVEGRVVAQLGEGAGEFGMPNSMAVTSAGEVHVVDSKAHRIRVYGPDHRAIFTYGEDELLFPTDIAIHEGAGTVYVSDFGANEIAVFDLQGNRTRSIAAPINDRGDPVFFRPLGLGLAPGGGLYVVDNLLSTVAALRPDGSLYVVYGYREGQYWTGDLSLPIDAASDGNRVYIVSNGTGQVHVFEVGR